MLISMVQQTSYAKNIHMPSDNVKDFAYLYEATLAIGYKDLYNNAKAMSERPDGYCYHKAGFGSNVCHKYRKTEPYGIS